MTAHTKALNRVSIKDAETGQVEAVFATFNVKDLDGDVTVPGAFADGQPVRISAYGHRSWDGALPVGKGVIRTTDTEAILDGQFFLNTTHGRNTFETVKGLGELQQWSYGFDIVDSEAGQHEDEDVRFLKALDVHEVSPVLLGAGVDTRTLAVKGQPLSEHLDGVLGDVETAFTRVRALGGSATGSKEGRVLSAANRDRLISLHATLGELHGSLGEWIADTDPEKDRDMLLRELLRFEQLRASLT